MTTGSTLTPIFHRRREESAEGRCVWRDCVGPYQEPGQARHPRLAGAPRWRLVGNAERRDALCPRIAGAPRWRLAGAKERCMSCSLRGRVDCEVLAAPRGGFGLISRGQWRAHLRA
eukprot:9129851-Pyramimonas_sp.AAC.1